LETTQATSQASETSQAEETATTLVTVTTKGESSTVLIETSTAISEATITAETTTGADTTTGAETTTAEATTTAETTTAEAGTTTTDVATTTTEAETTTAEAACPQNTVLANPTPIFVASADNPAYDDSYKMITIPFPVGIYGASSSDVYVSTNGILSLFSGTSLFGNNELPYSSAPEVSLMVYWDDLFITSAACNVGIFYDVSETDRGQAVTVEWNVGANGNVEHFTATLYKDHPGLVRYEYLETSKKGNSATIGLQNLLDDPLYYQFSYNTINSIPNQYYVEIDTSSGEAVTTSGDL
jgi:hypothetical protein